MRPEDEIRKEVKRLFAKLNSDSLRPFEASELNYKMQALWWVLGDDAEHPSDIILCPKCGNEAELMDAMFGGCGELVKTPYARCLTCKYEW